MSRPDPQKTAALSRAMAGAVDLSGLRARADATRTSSAPGAPPGAASGSWVIDVTEQTFQAEVLERSLDVLVVVDLWASWCEPCKQLSPVLERLAKEGRGSWILAKVDVDAYPRISEAFGVQSLPTVIALAGGQPVQAFSGAQPEAQVRQWVEALVSEFRDQMPGITAAEQAADAPAAQESDDPRFTAAEDALQRGEYAEAQAAYQAILDVEPANEQAAAALVQARFMARTEQTDPASIAKADADPADLTAQLAAADAEVAGERVEQAFARLVACVGRSAGEDRERVREHLLGLFELFPPDDARVTAARRALARVLF